jgi:hypothetical protein
LPISAYDVVGSSEVLCFCAFFAFYKIILFVREYAKVFSEGKHNFCLNSNNGPLKPNT